MPRCLCSLLLLVMVAVCPCAQAHEFFYDAVLAGLNESPPNASPGTGVAHLFLDLDLITMNVDLTFSGLVGTVTGAHIHAPTALPGTGSAIPATTLPAFPAFPVGVSAGSYDQTVDLADGGTYNPAFITASGGTISDALNNLFFSLADGKAYIDIHTTAFPDGEIRGFLVAVPEPSSMALLFGSLLGGVGLGALRFVMRPRREWASL